MLTPSGFERLLERVFALEEGGLCWLAPVCSSFVWSNTANTLRTKDNPDGDPEYKSVKEGNIYLSVCIFVVVICLTRRIYFALENPLRSLIDACSLWTRWMARHRLHKTFLTMCRFTPKRAKYIFKKPLKLYANSEWLRDVGKWCTCKKNTHLS